VLNQLHKTDIPIPYNFNINFSITISSTPRT